MGLTGGFSFCGVDINNLGLTYVPEMSNTYAPIAGADFNVSSLTDGTMDGGYFYGTTLKPKEFTLRCIFEMDWGDVRHGFLMDVENVFRRGRTGRLVFKDREWIWYTATVTDQVDTGKLTNRAAGFVTIKLTAYYPYGRGVGLYFDTNNEDKKAINSLDYKYIIYQSGYIKKDRMPSKTITWDANGEAKLLYYNPGTEYARTALKIQGDLTNGITVINETTGQKCEAAGINTLSELLVIDGLNGKVALADAGTLKTNPAFLYHRGGFIELAPYGDILSSVELQKTDARKYIAPTKQFNERYIGKWIMAAGSTMKIVNVENGALITDRENEASIGSYLMSDIVGCVNEITLKKKDGVTVNTFDIEYRPTFR